MFENITKDNVALQKLKKSAVNALYGRLGMQQDNSTLLCTSDEAVLYDPAIVAATTKLSKVNNHYLVECNTTMLPKYTQPGLVLPRNTSNSLL